MVQTIKFSQFAAGSLSNTANMIVGVSSGVPTGTNFMLKFPLVWTTATRPSLPALGLTGFNSSFGQVEYWNGAAWVQLAAGGSGSVSLGSVNELAFYASTGTTVSGLTTIASGVLVTDVTGAPSISTTLPNVNIGTPLSGTLTNCGGLPSSGIVPNNGVTPPASGKIGQTIFAQVTQASGHTIPNATNSVVTSISVPAGVWKIEGNGGFQDLANNFVDGRMWINNDGSTVNDLSLQTVLQITGANAVNQAGYIFYPNQTINSTTTFYLMALQGNTGGMAINTYGYIQATRIA